MEREVAAALESVFPRISLKAFINLNAEEKYAQLDELANIVLGIRVFNQHIGKGGVNIPNPQQESAALLQKLGVTLSGELETAQQTCSELQQVIVHSLLRHPPGVTVDLLRRWKDELTNRRQFVSYLQSLQEDMAVSERKFGALREATMSEMRSLQELVGNRASVPKEHVYPKFYEIAGQWTALYHEFKVVTGRTRTMDVLRTFRSSYTASLRQEIDTQPNGKTALEEDALAAEAAVEVTQTHESDNAALQAEKNVADKGGDQSDDNGTSKIPTHARQSRSQHTMSTDVKEDIGTERPVKLSIESTPEFMQLPLEYQGFCSWTIVKRQGLLLPGKPELGVIRYRNRFFVFAHEVAINAFMNDPECFVKGALERARHSPELIHLLRLQEAFPETCITRMLQRGTTGNTRPKFALTTVERREAATETPLHFVEGAVDPRYHWNEWVLRRRALQVANLRCCVTKSQQTDSSHFRRSNETQVYLQRGRLTQTNRSSGTQPPQQVQYFAGDASFISIKNEMLLSSTRMRSHEMQFTQCLTTDNRLRFFVFMFCTVTSSRCRTF